MPAAMVWGIFGAVTEHQHTSTRSKVQEPLENTDEETFGLYSRECGHKSAQAHTGYCEISLIVSSFNLLVKTPQTH